MEKEKDNRGGKRAGAGRPPKKTEEKHQRATRQIRAFDDEWELIKEFALLVRENKEKCKLAINLLKIK